ncbi:MAG: ribosomal-processing cysteine protease Prp [Clostridia bacterium]|nr:ribosomal-processing cysteine protease Prp [Clostridia bacterium]
MALIRHSGRPAGFAVSGHSGYADAGEDILCAAISMAVSLAECQLNDVLGAGAEVLVDEKKALIRVELPQKSTDAVYQKCAPALQAFEMVLRQYAAEYTDYISISEE